LTWSDVRRRGRLQASDFTVALLTFLAARVGITGATPPGADSDEASPRFDYSFWLLENDLEDMVDNATIEGWASFQRARRIKPSSTGRPASPAPPKPPIKKHTILFLAANPSETGRLALDEEARAIREELQRSTSRDSFEFETRWAVRALDLLRELRQLKPTVVHFSGHGSHDGLVFQTAGGHARVVDAAAITDAFGAAGASVKLVVLSACYTEGQAEALLAHVACVVGIDGAIGDDAACNFAIGFYGGIGEREPVGDAYKQGCAAIRLEGLADADRPQLKAQAGVDVNQLVLIADPR
jgi:hypothetical protein